MTRSERWDAAGLAMAGLALSGVLPSLWTKSFGYAPPAPDIVSFGPLLLVMVVHMLVRFRSTVVGAAAAWPWTALAALALASVAWSVSPRDTLREAGVLAVAVPYMAMIAVRLDWRTIVGTLWALGLAMLVFAMILYLVAPGFGTQRGDYEGALVGPWFEKNAAGQFGLWVAGLSVAMGAMRPKWSLPAGGAFALCLVFIILTQSATSLLAALTLAPVALWVALMRRPRLLSLPLLWLSLAAAVPIVVAVLSSSDELLALLGRQSTLTGRVPIWTALEDFALGERPRLGHGYGAYWSEDIHYGRRAFVFDALGFEARHSHNAWLEMRLALGWPGGLLLVAAFVQAVLLCLARLRGTVGGYFALPFLLAAFLVGLVETSVANPSQWGGMLFVLVLAKASLPARENDRMSGWDDFKAGFLSQPQLARDAATV